MPGRQGGGQWGDICTRQAPCVLGPTAMRLARHYVPSWCPCARCCLYIYCLDWQPCLFYVCWVGGSVGMGPSPLALSGSTGLSACGRGAPGGAQCWCEACWLEQQQRVVAVGGARGAAHAARAAVLCRVQARLLQMCTLLRSDPYCFRHTAAEQSARVAASACQRWGCLPCDGSCSDRPLSRCLTPCCLVSDSNEICELGTGRAFVREPRWRLLTAGLRWLCAMAAV
jgi:hypothetical protein